MKPGYAIGLQLLVLVHVFGAQAAIGLSASDCPRGCLECDNQRNCTKCHLSYYITASVCLECPSSCKHCSEPATCIVCNDGYKIQTGKCVEDTFVRNVLYAALGVVSLFVVGLVLTILFCRKANSAVKEKLLDSGDMVVGNDDEGGFQRMNISIEESVGRMTITDFRNSSNAPPIPANSIVEGAGIIFAPHKSNGRSSDITGSYGSHKSKREDFFSRESID